MEKGTLSHAFHPVGKANVNVAVAPLAKVATDWVDPKAVTLTVFEVLPPLCVKVTFTINEVTVL